MGKMPIDVRTLSEERVRGALGRVGRWTLMAIARGLALIGFLHLTRGNLFYDVVGLMSQIGVGK